MIACYIRVSTTSQNSEGQKKDVRRWLKGQGHKAKDVRWFEDKETGKHTDRPAFKQLQSAVFMGEAKTVVVWRLCLLYTSPSPRDRQKSRMPSSA